jgi:hypothetical protein
MPQQHTAPSKPTDSSRFISDDKAKAFWKSLNPSEFPKQKRIPFPQVGYLINEVNALGQLKSDLKDLVLTHLFSSNHLTSHQLMTGPEKHSFIRTRVLHQKQPSETASSDSDNQKSKKLPTSTSPASKPAPKGKAAIAALIEAKILIKASNLDHTSFKTAFPGTTFPHLSMLNGLPKCNKATFNSLLTSKLRAAKKVLGLKPTDRLEADIVVFVSRQIDKMFILELNDRKAQRELKEKKKTQISKPQSTHSSAETPVAKKPKTKKQKKTVSRAIEFVSESKPTIEDLQKQIASLQLQLEEAKAQPAAISPPTRSANSVEYITESELKVCLSFLKDSKASPDQTLESALPKFNKFIVPLGPEISSRIINPNSGIDTSLAIHLRAKTDVPLHLAKMIHFSPEFVSLDQSRLDVQAISQFKKLRVFHRFSDAVKPSDYISTPLEYPYQSETVWSATMLSILFN